MMVGFSCYWKNRLGLGKIYNLGLIFQFLLIFRYFKDTNQFIEVFLGVSIVFSGEKLDYKCHDIPKNQSIFRDEPAIQTISVMTPPVSSLIFITCITNKFQSHAPSFQQRDKLFFVTLNKSNRKPINKNFGVEIFLNKIKINTQSTNYQI